MAQTLDGRTVFRQIWNDCRKNIIFFGAAVAVIVLVGSYIRWLGLVLFAGFALITLADVLKLLFVAGLNMMMLPIKVIESLRNWHVARDEAWVWGATLVQGVELAIFVVYNVYLYVHFFR